MAAINHLSVTEELKNQVLNSLQELDYNEIPALPQSSFIWVRLRTQEQIISARQKCKRIFVQRFGANERELRHLYYVCVPAEDAIRCAL